MSLKALSTSDEDYEAIEEMMQETIKPNSTYSHYKIESIRKIKNQELWGKYKRYADNIGFPFFNDLSDTERFLFHGTPSYKEIIREGFKMGNPNGLFGGGVYFAKHSSKSNQYVFPGGRCSKHSSTVCYECSRYILLCRVELGDFLRTEELIRIENVTLEGFNSIKVKPSHRLPYHEYVISNPAQVFPQYLIKYKIRR